MNRRLISVAVLGLGLSLGANLYAQTAVAPSVKTAAAIGDKERSTIQQFISAQVARLTGKDTVAQQEGREALVNEATSSAATAAYTDAYTKALNSALVQLADNPAVRIRLNAAIVANRVAERVENVNLKPAISRLLSDKSEAVALAGMKAAKGVIPVMVRSSSVTAKDPLFTDMLKCVERMKFSGLITQAAYDALRLNVDSTSDRKNLSPAMIQTVVPVVDRILAARIGEYAKGTPDAPTSDIMGANFLVYTYVWKSQTPEQQVATAQVLVDLLATASRRTADLDGKDNRAMKDEVVQVLKGVAKAIQVVAETVTGDANNTVSTAATTVTKLDLSVDSKVIISSCDDLVASITLIPRFQNVKKPALSQAPAKTSAAK